MYLLIYIHYITPKRKEEGITLYKKKREMGNVGGAYGWGRGVSVCLSVLYMLEWRGVTYRESERGSRARLWGGILLVYGTQ